MLCVCILSVCRLCLSFLKQGSFRSTVVQNKMKTHYKNTKFKYTNDSSILMILKTCLHLTLCRFSELNTHHLRLSPVLVLNRLLESGTP